MHRLVKVAHSSFIEASHMTKNTAPDFNDQFQIQSLKLVTCLISADRKFSIEIRLVAAKVVFIRLGNYVFVNKARGGGSPKSFINTL
jgi:hypothetical protein